MSSDASSTSNRSMQKWGIPTEGRSHRVAACVPPTDGPESSVLERLVWVRYNHLWWPAVLYRSYLELQKHLYSQLNSYVVKAQFALAIMRQLQEKRNVQLARLLGRPSLEIVEVEEGTYKEFYWHVADLLPEACDKLNYVGQLDLFLDIHRALDEVEAIFREVANETILLSLDEQGTWLERAQKKLMNQQQQDYRIDATGHRTGDNYNDEVSVNSLRRFRQSLAEKEENVDWSPIHPSSASFAARLRRTGGIHENLPLEIGDKREGNEMRITERLFRQSHGESDFEIMMSSSSQASSRRGGQSRRLPYRDTGGSGEDPSDQKWLSDGVSVATGTSRQSHNPEMIRPEEANRPARERRGNDETPSHHISRRRRGLGSQRPPLKSQGSRADTEKAHNLSSTEEFMTTPRSKYRSRSPLSGQRQSPISSSRKSPESQYQTRNPSSSKRSSREPTAQSLLAEAKKQQMMGRSPSPESTSSSGQEVEKTRRSMFCGA